MRLHQREALHERESSQNTRQVQERESNCSASQGNKSKYEDEVSQMYKNIKQAIDEEEEHAEVLNFKVR